MFQVISMLPSAMRMTLISVSTTACLSSKDLHHVCKIQNGTADTVEFVDNNPFDFSPWVSYLQYASWLSTEMLSFFLIDCLAYNASYIGIFFENLIELRSDFLSGFLLWFILKGGVDAGNGQPHFIFAYLGIGCRKVISFWHKLSPLTVSLNFMRSSKYNIRE